MASYNPEIFTQFVYDTLNNDSAITALITGVYSYVLQDTAAPYLVIDVNSAKPLNASSFAGMEVNFSVTCFSTEAGYAEVFNIMEKVFIALQAKTATLTGYEVINTRLVDSEYNRLKDGKGIEAVLEFRSVIQEN